MHLPNKLPSATGVREPVYRPATTHAASAFQGRNQVIGADAGTARLPQQENLASGVTPLMTRALSSHPDHSAPAPAQCKTVQQRAQLATQNSHNLHASFQRFLTAFRGAPETAAFAFTQFAHQEINTGQLQLEPQAYQPEHADDPRGWAIQTVLATDYAGCPVTVVAFVWGAGQYCEIHGHKNDCGFIRAIGQNRADHLFDREYAMDENGKLEEIERVDVGSGASRLYHPEAHAIHRMETPITNTDVVVSFHFYARGANENGAIDLLQWQKTARPTLRRLASGEISVAPNGYALGLDTTIHLKSSTDQLVQPKRLLKSGLSSENLATSFC